MMVVRVHVIESEKIAVITNDGKEIGKISANSKGEYYCDTKGYFPKIDELKGKSIDDVYEKIELAIGHNPVYQLAKIRSVY